MGNRTRVKICGITCVEDAILAAEAGADAVGLIFHPPASRGISTVMAEEITSALPPFVDPVALFLDTPAFSISAITRRLKITWVQLHGHETPRDVAELPEHHVMKAIHVRPGKLEEALGPWHEAVAKGLPNLRALVLETGWTNVQGGSGIENDWDQILAVQSAGGFDGLPPIILAGGLRPSSVGEVIERLHPWAVDVSSGVEEVKGRKASERVRAFIRAVRHADHNNHGVATGA